MALSQSPQLPIEAFLYLCYRDWQRCVLGSWRGEWRQDEQGSWSTSSHYSVAGGGESWEWLRRSLSTDIPHRRAVLQGVPSSQMPILRVLGAVPHLYNTQKERSAHLQPPPQRSCKRLWASERMLGAREAGRVRQGSGRCSGRPQYSGRR